MTTTRVVLTVLIMATAALQAATKQVTVFFDASRLGKETRGEATQFTYNHPDCRYVEHCTGAPVLPVVEVHVVVPPTARYKDCRVRAASQRLKGLHTFYTRTFDAGVMNSARRFPPKLIEFAGVNRIGGYRVFTFRAYPVMCQPGDGSAACILRAQLQIEYELGEGERAYPESMAGQVAMVKRAVVNPDDVERFTRVPSSGTGREDGSTHAMFATRIRDRSAVNRYGSAGSGSDQGGLLAFIKDNVYISEDNDIVYAPFEF